MATLDIRHQQEGEITEIAFGSGYNSNSCKVVKASIEDEVILHDHSSFSTGFIAISDIDNLILALQKAKELWG